MKYQLHPACAAWPPMSDSELAELTKSIASIGLMEPITLTPDRLLLDGRNRALACEANGIEPSVTIYDGDDPVGYSIFKNKHRRHLDKVELALAAQALETLKHGSNRYQTKARKVENATALSKEEKTRSDIAKELGITVGAINNASTIIEKGIPEIETIVRAKKVGLRTAADYVRKTPKDKQVADPAVIRKQTIAEPEPYGGPDITAARRIVRGLLDAGKLISRTKLAAEHGLVERAFDMAIAIERAVDEAKAAPPIPADLSVFGPTVQKRIETLQKHLEMQFADRVQAELTRRLNEEVLPFYKERLAKADQLSKFGKPFTNAEYRLLLAALHPDSHAERCNEAFVLVKSKEVLLRPEEKEHPFTADLPASVAELLARRRYKAR